MKKIFTVDHAEKTIFGSKTALKKAGVFGSPEYKELVKMMTMLPEYKVSEKEINKKEGKKSYKGLTENFIRKYISIKGNAEELLAEYDRAYKMGKFSKVRSWFIDTFKDFDMTAAMAEIHEYELGVIRGTIPQKAVVSNSDSNIAVAAAD